ncbi:alpha/beta hydrolase-fold protein [Fulvimarina sp. 2208YS6-2-32]|uniref:Alpha/beta hydrolase-fold protein n=1 Tax=Fulvimarina uroteuthidis TaxID=3098149 RepID=A0ABU5I6T2_9HYPH|nr:alpha/beta hydrolase-fold protein [Fulvimarina sp. 2208YS6-2-32]MDY8110830.1 alpha/beta hydrolase-fold protein [Fulvimarina sp. 2208YS6-2-32]
MIDAGGLAHRIWIKAFGAAPAAGWPTLVLLDGNASVPLASRLGEKEHAGPLLIVGIGYPEDDRQTIIRRRYRDLTSRASRDGIPTRDPQTSYETGGRDAFLAFLTDRVLPFVETLAPLGRTTLFGHSLAGHLAVNAVLTSRFPARSIVAADPSVWWNRHDLMRDAEAFRQTSLADHRGAVAHLRIMMAGRRLEREGLDADARRRIEMLRTGPGGADLAARLSGDPRLVVSLSVHPEQTHGSIVRPAIDEAIRLAGMPG